ncbi:hypothetical protein CXF72_13125 [Psychromonas sp. MB-3u-54]|uniref:dynamin family protein n=1 Tax=Psychromonas sp. MB-3u-54 TaxID=2058319 RepID=UPI000C346C40|nr:dynamin family protein [Psychromonas sp. MB-3u-54]PKH02141.1 hypothetical protein CXF72_13125 [Psychromonas sp. MB-3u-54]
MTNNLELMDRILHQLPFDWREPVDELGKNLLQTASPLRLIVLGSFSVGKSSLLNMLLKDSFLQTAKEETTALPTFIEYGQEKKIQLINFDGDSHPLSANEFARVTVQAPEGAAYALLSLPYTWLQGVSIIDLPGLGSTSTTHHNYMLSQIDHADAVMYLLPPTGPSKSDLKMLSIINESGKRLKVLVARWDVVEDAKNRGEKSPSLLQWSNQIEQFTNLRTSLIPCSQMGLGKDAIFDFIQGCKEELSSIRLRRFRAELKPMLENALGQNEAKQRSCLIETEDNIQKFHQEIIHIKKQLSEFKSSLYVEQRKDYECIERCCDTLIQASQQKLKCKLNDNIDQLSKETDWENFSEKGGQLLRSTLLLISKEFRNLSNDYGAISLPEPLVVELNLRLPCPDTISVEEFLDIGKLSQLDNELKKHEDEFTELEQKLISMPVNDMTESEATLLELIHKKESVEYQSVNTVVQQVGGSNGGVIGRFIGEVADIGLMFVNPTAAGTKIASALGKGAKMANLAVNTVKVTKHATTGVKVVQAAQQGKGVRGVPKPIMDKLARLEVISMAYWGGEIGSKIGGAPVDIEVADPQAIADKEAELARLSTQILEINRALERNEDIANERQLTGWALEQNKKEQKRYQNELQIVQVKAESQFQEEQQYQLTERNLILQRHAERAISHWLRSSEQQASSMYNLLHVRVKSYWEDRVESMVNIRLEEVEQLTAQQKSSKEDKHGMLECLYRESDALNLTLSEL